MLPENIRQFLWSYDTKKIDLDKDKRAVILNILNLGDARATRWLFRKYNPREIKKAVKDSMASEWNKKSLNYWSIILDARPVKSARFL